MAGLVPAIQDSLHRSIKDVDARDKSGHDGFKGPLYRKNALSYTGNPLASANSFSEVCGRAPMCWITSAAASAPSLPAFS